MPPCPACPLPPGAACLGRPHPIYCDKMAAEGPDGPTAAFLRAHPRAVDSVPAAPAEPRAADSGISVVVAARDYGRFLGAALRSALAQSDPPLEVIYSDDGSRDDSLAVARSIPGVRVLESPGGPEGVCAARNRGVAAARGQHLVHLDGDDQFPSDYLRCKRDALQAAGGDGFVYSRACHFDGLNTMWDIPAWDRSALWTRNFINTSTLIPADLFRKVGGWREGIGVVWDWDLFTRAARHAPGIPDHRGVLLYRAHGASVTDGAGLRADREGRSARMHRLFRLTAARTRIGCILSDRILALWPAWLARIAACWEHAAARLAQERPLTEFGSVMLPRPELAVWYTGEPRHAAGVLRAIDQYPGLFRDVDFRARPWRNEHASERERGDNVATFLAGAYDWLNATDAEVVWTVEDDILPPVTAYGDLQEALLGGDTPLYAAAGWYRSRHEPAFVVAHDIIDGQPVPIPDPRADVWADLSGTGCLMTFRPFAPHGYGSHALGHAAHDWAWCQQLARCRQGWPYPTVPRVRIVAAARCRHYRTAADWV